MANVATPAGDSAELERFVVDNDDLLRLEAIIGTFNIFDALRIERTEIRHSNFLAWLLNPSESHGQGDLFLKPLLMDLLKRTPTAQRPLGPLDLDGLDLSQVEIRREWKSIDLLIESKSPAFVIAIENKVDSGEHSDQLQRYETIVAQEFPNVRALHVFLTPDGDDASDEDWVSYSYGDIFRAFNRVRLAAKGSLGSDVAVFLDHYLNLIGSRFMENKDIEDLCKRIYVNHRRAVELLIEHVSTPASGVNAAVEKYFRADEKAWTVFRVRNKMVYFVPTAWIGHVCTADGEQAPGIPCPIYLETAAGKRSLRVRWVVGPGPDPVARKALIEHLILSKDLALTPQRKQITDLWTRVWASKVMEWEEDQIPEEEEVVQKLAKFMPPVEQRLSMLPKAIRAFTP